MSERLPLKTPGLASGACAHVNPPPDLEVALFFLRNMQDTRCKVNPLLSCPWATSLRDLEASFFRAATEKKGFLESAGFRVNAGPRPRHAFLLAHAAPESRRLGQSCGVEPCRPPVLPPEEGAKLAPTRLNPEDLPSLTASRTALRQRKARRRRPHKVSLKPTSGYSVNLAPTP